MSTRCRIAKKNADGTFDSIYSHWDGYPQWVGNILYHHYTDPNKINALLDLGDISSLGEDIGEKHNFDGNHEGIVNAYGRDRGEKNVDAKRGTSFEELAKLVENGWGEYLYVFDEGVWKFCPIDKLQPDNYGCMKVMTEKDINRE